MLILPLHIVQLSVSREQVTSSDALTRLPRRDLWAKDKTRVHVVFPTAVAAAAAPANLTPIAVHLPNTKRPTNTILDLAAQPVRSLVISILQLQDLRS